VSVDFQITGITLLAGAPSTAADDPKAPGVVASAPQPPRCYFGPRSYRRHLRGTNPLAGGLSDRGVVGDVLRTGLGVSQQNLQVYRPIMQRPRLATCSCRPSRPDTPQGRANRRLECGRRPRHRFVTPSRGFVLKHQTQRAST